MSMDVSGLEGGLYADTASEHIRITTALLVLATVFVGLRFLARYTHGAGFAKDDWACIAALVATFATGGLNYGMLHWGLGKHAAALSQEQLETFFKYLLAFECIYVTGVAAVKICLLLMYIRIFPTRGFKIASCILGGLTIAWWLSICLVCIFQCNPIRKAWQPWLELGKCINLKASFIGNAVPNIATDAAIICLPIYQVWKLQINRVQKISLMGVFLLGTFVFFASIYRFTTIMQFDIMDTTWTLATACTWCVVEVAVGLISVCLPTLRPLLVKVSRKFGSSLRDISNKYGSNHNTELMTIGGGGSKGATRSFNQLSGREPEQYGTTTSIGRSHSQQGSSMDKDLDSSSDEAPLRPEKTYTAVIHVNRDFKRTETTIEG